MMRTITIDGLFNVRASDVDSPWLIRSGALQSITAAGIDEVRALGVDTILDLREPDEAERTHAAGVRTVNVPIYGEQPPNVGRLETIYEALLRERGDALARAVAIIADADGAVLVHCTAGKDRTGLVVALARSAAGAGVDEVIDDYRLSGAAVRPRREAVALRAAADADTAVARADTLRLHLDSPVEAIRHALTVIDESGGSADYLLAHGLTTQHIAALRRKHGGAA